MEKSYKTLEHEYVMWCWSVPYRPQLISNLHHFWYTHTHNVLWFPLLVVASNLPVTPRIKKEIKTGCIHIVGIPKKINTAAVPNPPHPHGISYLSLSLLSQLMPPPHQNNTYQPCGCMKGKKRSSWTRKKPKRKDLIKENKALCSPSQKKAYETTRHCIPVFLLARNRHIQ